MLSRELLHKSSLLLGQGTFQVERPLSPGLFRRGGEWMQDWLMHWDGSSRKPAGIADFRAYGWGKYAFCLLVMALSAAGLYRLHPVLAFLSVPLFYLAEVHFLFLFPLLIDGAKHPIRESIRLTYRVGLFRAMACVMPIGCYMVLGLASVSDPFKNWHRGCLAVLIWYQDEVRARA